MQSYSQYPLSYLRLAVNDLLELIAEDENALLRHQENEVLKLQYETLRMQHIHDLADLLKTHYQLKNSLLTELPL